jgi:hypothetical protein
MPRLVAPHEWRTITDLIREHAPWRAYPDVLADPDFISAWLAALVMLDARGDLTKETLLGWWQETEEYRNEWPTWEARPSEPGEPEPIPPGALGRYALAGIVQATPRGWKDAAHTRPILGASWFPALRILRDDPARFTATLDRLQSWGVQMVRSFLFVTHPAYWPGREVLATDAVDPQTRREIGEAWPDFDRVLVAYASALGQRGMRAFLTAGDLQYSPAPAHVYARAHAALKGAGLLHVVGFVDVNEPWQNGTGGDDPARGAAWLRPFAAEGIPWSPGAHSAGDEDLNAMWRPAGAPVETVHGPGGREHMVRHIFNHRFEGVGFAVALAQGEPRGPGADVSAGRVNETGWIALAGCMAGMTGQLYVLHCSRGIRDRDDDDPWESFAPYFLRTRAMLDRLPWARVAGTGHGGRGGTNVEALFASTRPDGAFHGDREGIVGEFHRCDSVRYESGEVAALLYGGTGVRSAKVVRPITGAFFDTHGREIRSVQLLNIGDVVTFENAGDGILFVGRRV